MKKIGGIFGFLLNSCLIELKTKFEYKCGTQECMRSISPGVGHQRTAVGVQHKGLPHPGGGVDFHFRQETSHWRVPRNARPDNLLVSFVKRGRAPSDHRSRSVCSNGRLGPRGPGSPGLAPASEATAPQKPAAKFPYFSPELLNKAMGKYKLKQNVK